MKSTVHSIPPRASRARFLRWLRFLLVAGVVVFSGVLAMPFWLGPLLTAALPRFGITVGEYERIGYSRFRLGHLTHANGQVEISISGMQTYQPLLWVYQSMGGILGEPMLRVDGIEVMLAETEAAVGAEPDSTGFPTLLKSIEQGLETVLHVLPSGRVSQVKVVRERTLVELKELQWDKVSMSTRLFPTLHASLPAVDLQLELQSDSSMELSVREPVSGDQIVAVLTSRVDKAQVRLSLEGMLAGQQWTGQAEWMEDQWLPSKAVVDVPQLVIKPSRWGWDAAPLERVDGRIAASWQQGNYALDFSLREAGDDETEDGGKSLLAGAMLEVKASGDLNHLQVEQAVLDSAVASLVLPEPIRYDFQSASLTGQAFAELDLALEDLGITGWRGQLSGTLELGQRPWESDAHLRYTLEGASLELGQIAVERVRLQGWVNREEVAVEHLALEGSNSSVLEGSVTYLFRDRRIKSGLLKGDIDSSILEAWIPASLEMGRLRIESSISGELDDLHYEGSLSLDTLKVNGVQPLAVSLDLSGNRDALQLERLQVHSALGGVLEGSGNWTWRGQPALKVNALHVGHAENGMPTWVLQEPIEIRTTNQAILGIGPSFEIDDVRLGSATTAQLSFGISEQDSTLWLRLSDFNVSDMLQPWVEALLPNVNVSLLEFQAEPRKGSLALDGKMEVNVLDAESGPLSVRSHFALDEQGLRVDSTELRSDGKLWLTMQGQLPYGLDLQSVQLRHLPNQALSLRVQTAHSEAWLPWLKSYMDIPLQQADLALILEGTSDSPTGTLQLKCITDAGMGEHQLPPVTLEGAVQMHGTLLDVESMRVQLADSRFELAGQLSLPEQLLRWIHLERPPIPWETAHLKLKSSRSDLAPLASLWPEILRPAGSMQFELQGSLSEGLKGELQVAGLSTRAIFPFGSVRDLDFSVMLDGRRVELKRFLGRIAREPLHASGWLEFPDADAVTFDFEIRGEQIPVVRQAGILLRTDMQLRMQQQGGSANLTGVLNLRDGFFLTDITQLLDTSAGGRSATSRPPYFSVDVPPFADWRLDVAVQGDGFMQLKTPVVDGVMSMEMNLGGTLGEPVMLGRVWFEEGSVKFPFAVFDVEQGVVQLNRNDPYVPRLELRATSSRLDYQLQMLLTGSALEPELSFSAAPSLSQDQILMMVVAGIDPAGRVEYSSTQRASKIGTYLSSGLLGAGDSSGLLSRLEMQWGNQLSRRGRETLELEFELNEEFQLLGEYDEYDNWNAGIRWRILDPAQRRSSLDTETEEEESDES